MSSNRFFERKDLFGSLTGLFRVNKPTFVFARLNEVMSQRLDCNRRAISMSLESFGDALVQATAANRVQFFVQHLANLVMSERECITMLGDQQLRGCSF